MLRDIYNWKSIFIYAGWTAEDYAMIGGHEQLALDLKVPHCAPSLPATDMEDLELSSTDELNDMPNVSWKFNFSTNKTIWLSFNFWELF